MTNNRLDLWRRADELFNALLDRPVAERREALEKLDIDDELRAHLLKLIEADAKESGLLDVGIDRYLGSAESETDESESRTDLDDHDIIGRRFGPFVIEKEIGRGGMSVVYLARRGSKQPAEVEQPSGFEQRVALKILTLAASLTPGTRLQREMAILSRLRHPHIATLIDAGIEPDGTRWLAMEWVEGLSIEEFCHDWQPRRIAELFLEVCDAVDYAHRNLVVHRDLKPSNILVDVEGHVRLLDFGIAKLLDETGSDAGEATRALTPRYGAPEQFFGKSITTAADVFGLGSVLFRLLTGHAPRQSTSSLVPTPPDLSHLHSLDRDLQAILRSCLQTDPVRRYASANLLREDLGRWLDGHAIRAVGESRFYRLRKLVGRHRTLTASAVLLMLAIAGGTASTYRQAERARLEAESATREAQRARATSDFLLDLFAFADPDHSQGESLTVRHALDAGARQLGVQLENEPRLRAELLATVGEIYRRLGLYDDAAPLHEKAAELSAGSDVEARVQLHRARLALSRFEPQQAERSLETALTDSAQRTEALQLLAVLRQTEGRAPEAKAALKEALDIEQAKKPQNDEAIASIRLAQADVAFGEGEIERAGELYREALTQTRAAFDGDHTAVARALESVGGFEFEIGNTEGALEKIGEARAIRERLLGEEHPDVAYTLTQIAQVERSLGRIDQAEANHRRALELQRQRLGSDHPDVISTLNSIAILAYDRGDFEKSVALLDDVVDRSRRSHGPKHPTVAELLTNLAAVRRSMGHFQPAEQHLREALEIYRDRLGEETLAVGHCYSQLGNLARARAELDEAGDFYRRALSSIEAAAGASHPEALATRANLAGLAFERGLYDEAVSEYREAHEVARETLSWDHPLRAAIATRLARSLLRTEDSAEALPLVEEVVEAVIERYPPEAGRRLEAEAVFGAALLAAGRKADGEKALSSVQSRLEAGARSATAESEIARWLGR